MNDFEREKARQMMEHQKNMKDPDYAKVYQEMQRRKKEREKSEESLKRFGVNGACPPPEVGENHPKEKTVAEMRHKDILKHFS